MSIVVTGGAGFIGSCIVRMLNEEGIEDIVIVDDIGSTEKWMNIRNKRYLDYLHKSEFIARLDTFNGITTIIHMGACTSTTEKDFDYLWENNFRYTQTLWSYCCHKQISFIYASSAATYGDGALGFNDDMNINNLLPLNGYGYSKHFFDQWVKKQQVFPLQHVGLKFFNVYGPNEYSKGSMASMIYHGYNQVRNDGAIKLFRSYNPKYKDGEQMRDFVYVKDICDIVKFFLNHREKSGLYNVGTGKAQSFAVLAEAIFHSLEMETNIVYIDMPEHLVQKYQYFTQANINTLRNVGYLSVLYDLNAGVQDYVQKYLDKGYLTY